MKKLSFFSIPRNKTRKETLEVSNKHLVDHIVGVGLGPREWPFFLLAIKIKIVIN